jgi:uncharacterized spore protein YtfJ
MTDADQVKAELTEAAEALDWMGRLGERVGVGARASAVFGEPVERDGVTVIPVAKSSWGFGGGSGGEAANQGSGGGGGGIVSPVGFIEVRNGSARFVATRDIRQSVVRLAVAAGVVAWMARRR